MRSVSDPSEHDQLLEQARKNAIGQREVDVELSIPVKVSGHLRSKLTMRRPTVGDLLEMQKKKGNDAEQERWLVGRLTQVPPDDLDAVDAADWDVLTAVLLGFRGGRVPSGA